MGVWRPHAASARWALADLISVHRTYVDGLESRDRNRNRRFGENLIWLRKRAQLSQQRTTERVGLHRVEISLLERNVRIPRLEPS